MTACPVCGSLDTVTTVQRPLLPVLQNRVYPTRDEALRAPTAPFELHTCSICGFSFNGRFNSSLVIYDEHYDNDVPSAMFMRYHEELARGLVQRFNLSDGTVYDVGCGKGTFLEVLCRMAPGIRGIGVDPSCTPKTVGNVTLIKDVFKPELVHGDARLVLLRHVLEHIEQPVPFLAAIVVAAPRAPIFVEVPDFAWILENGTFWDFCYEHCNYFTQGSLAHALMHAGYRVQEQLSLFAGQFQAIVAAPTKSQIHREQPTPSSAVQTAREYALSEGARMRAARHQIERAGSGAVLWGMATKGVVFASLMSSMPLAGGIDINLKKQHRFAPGSGLRINPPDWLTSLRRTPTIFVMNSNYESEIRRHVSALGVLAEFVNL